MRVFIAICYLFGMTTGITTQSGCTCKGSSEVKWREPGGTIGGGFSHYGCGTGPYEARSPANGQNWCDTQQSGCNDGQGWDFCTAPVGPTPAANAEAVNVNFRVGGLPPVAPSNNVPSVSMIPMDASMGSLTSAIKTVSGCTCHPTSEVILLQNGVRVGGGFSHTGCGTGPYEDNSPGQGSPWCDTMETWCSDGWDLCIPPESSQQSSYVPSGLYNPLPPKPYTPLSPQNFFPPQNDLNSLPSQNSFNPLLLQSSYTPPLPTFSPITNSLTSNTGAFQQFFPPTPYTMPPTPFTMPPTPFTMPPTPFTLPPTPFTMLSTPFTMPLTSFPGPPPTPFPQQAWHQPQPYQSMASFQPVTPAFQAPTFQPQKQPQPSYQPPQLQSQFQPQQYRYTAQPQQPSNFQPSVAITPVPIPVSKQVASPPRGPFTPPRQARSQRGGGFDYNYDDSGSSHLLPLLLLQGASSSGSSNLLPLMLATQGSSNSNMLPMMVAMGSGGLSDASALTKFAMLSTFRREGGDEVQDAASLGEIGQNLGFTRAIVSAAVDPPDTQSPETSADAPPSSLQEVVEVTDSSDVSQLDV